MIAAAARVRGQGIDSLRITAAQDDVVGRERFMQDAGDIVDASHPSRLPVPRQSPPAETIRHRFSMANWEAAEFEGNQDVLADEGGAETGPQAQEQQTAAVVPAERLHDGIVHQPDGTTERRFEVEAYPSAAKMARLDTRTGGIDRTGISDRIPRRSASLERGRARPSRVCSGERSPDESNRPSSSRPVASILT